MFFLPHISTSETSFRTWKSIHGVLFYKLIQKTSRLELPETIYDQREGQEKKNGEILSFSISMEGTSRITFSHLLVL